ncbi:MAG: NAD(P)/FAD-dependent oxidoreductase [Hespellia sp.]|nr:NAD(P)/FAD-dependent oxidoreductase [Hespellia sp.]
MERYDIAIIGTGPAGLSAAITAKIRNKNILLIGSKTLSPKVEKAHTIQNYLGMPEVSGAELQTAFTDHLADSQIEITEDKIHAIYAMGAYFMLQGSGANYEASSVILATGVSAGRLYEGEEQFLGRGVSYCATCDAALYKGKSAAIVGFSPKEEAEAEFMAEIADKVLYFPMYKDEVQFSEENTKDKIEVIREVPVSVEGSMKAERLVTRDNSYDVDGVFFLRESVSPAQLVPGLKMNGNHIEVTRNMATNIAGCFACGDIVGTPYQYIKSAGEGNVAALAAVSYLDQKKRAQK